MPEYEDEIEGGEDVKAEGEQPFEYEDNIAEDQKIRQTIADKFESLASDIDTTLTQVFNLLRIREDKKGVIYAVLTGEQDEDFFNELIKLNHHLGKAHAILDSYIRLSNSTPKFENFFNKIYNIMVRVRRHRQSIFYTVNVRNSGNHLYPFFELDNLLRELGLLFGRLRGVLSIGGDFIKDQPPRVVSPAGMGGGMQGGGGGEYGFNRPYYGGGVGGDYMGSYDSRISPERAKQERYRDIGDIQDR